MPSPPEDKEGERLLGTPPSGDTAPPEGSARRALIDKVNASLFLRRPLLLTGPPGSGKSSLAHQISRELGLGRVLRWSVNSRSTVRSALYEYDPLSQIHDLNLENARQRVHGTTDRRYAQGGDDTARVRESAQGIGRYLRLGPLGTAFLPYRLPRVLLIDNLDLGDYDLPGDLIDLFERGGYRIPELARLSGVAEAIDVGTDDPGVTASVHGGRVLCSAFPVVVLACGSDHTLSPSLLRYCLPARIAPPGEEELNAIVAAHFGGYAPDGSDHLVREFLRRGADGEPLAIDQLLGAIQLVSEVNNASPVPTPDQVRHLSDMLWHRLRDDRG